jgi:hypothetical protein
LSTVINERIKIIKYYTISLNKILESFLSADAKEGAAEKGFTACFYMPL